MEPPARSMIAGRVGTRSDTQARNRKKPVRSIAAGGSQSCQCFTPPARMDGPQSAAPTAPTMPATPHATTSFRNTSPQMCPAAKP